MTPNPYLFLRNPTQKGELRKWPCPVANHSIIVSDVSKGFQCAGCELRGLPWASSKTFEDGFFRGEMKLTDLHVMARFTELSHAGGDKGAPRVP